MNTEPVQGLFQLFVLDTLSGAFKRHSGKLNEVFCDPGERSAMR